MSYHIPLRNTSLGLQANAINGSVFSAALHFSKDYLRRYSIYSVHVITLINESSPLTLRD